MPISMICTEKPVPAAAPHSTTCPSPLKSAALRVFPKKLTAPDLDGMLGVENVPDSGSGLTPRPRHENVS